MLIGEVFRHIREESWPKRICIDADIRQVWEAAKPVHDPSVVNDCVARLDRETQTLLLAR